MSERPNYYQILDLDPAVDDWETIARRIAEKQDQWAMLSNQGNRKARSEAERNLSMLADIRKTLGDAAGRRREAEAARRLQRAAREAEERRLAESIVVLSSAGTCDEEQFQGLVREFAGVFSAREIEDRLGAAGIRRVQGGPQEPRRRAPRESIDPATAAAVRNGLQHLGLGSLYEFLGLPPSASAEALRARAEEIYKQNLKRPTADDRVSVSNDLAGMCKTLFANEDGKRRYDNFRLLEVIEEIKHAIELAGADRVISTDEMETLVRLAEQRGLNPDDARDAIEELAEKRGWSVQREVAKEPPPPRDLKVHALPDGFDLAWGAVRLSGKVRYRVLRQLGVPPRNDRDGTVLGEPGDTHCVDRPVPKSVSCYYAVYTLRDDLCSRLAAASGPHILQDAAPAAGAVPPRPPRGPARRSGLRPFLGASLAAGVLAAVLFLGNLLGSGGSPAIPPSVPPPPAHQVPPGPLARMSRSSTAASTRPSRLSPHSPAARPSPPPPHLSSPLPPPPSVLPTGPFPNPTNRNGASATVSMGGPEVSGTSASGNGLAIQTPVPPTPIRSPQSNHPTVAVVAVGDRLLASALEDSLLASLRNGGLEARESGIQRRGDSADLGYLLPALAAKGFQVVVLARVEALGRRELSFYGRKDVAYSAHLKIGAFRVSDEQPLGGGWSDSIEYTTVNAVSQASDAVQSASPSLIQAVLREWAAPR